MLMVSVHYTDSGFGHASLHSLAHELFNPIVHITFPLPSLGLGLTVSGHKR